MVLDKHVLDDHISRRGPFMFHVTQADAVPAILAGGLRPGSELGVSTNDGFFKTREGHVYLGDLSICPWLRCPARAPTSRSISASSILHSSTRTRIRCKDLSTGNGGGWVAKPPPVNSRDGVPEAVGPALADWAETTEGFDAPEIDAIHAVAS